MRTLEPAELLAVWERGFAQQPVERALTLLAAARPDLGAEDLVAMPIGRRDAALLALRERTFGPRFDGVTACAGCGATVECDFSVEHVRFPYDGDLVPALEIESGGRTIRFRLPHSGDLLAVAAAGGVGATMLMERCTDGAEVDDVAARTIAARMEAADPQADVQLAIGCPHCGAVFERVFDVVAYLWNEIAARAMRIVREVDALARAYGWREAEILAMTPWRRQLYLELAQ